MGTDLQRPLRVLELAFDYTAKRAGGLGAHVEDLAHGLVCAGCEVTVLTHGDAESSVSEECGVRVHYVGASRRTLSQTAHSTIADNVLAFNQDLIEYARALFGRGGSRPDIIHYHHWFTFSAAQKLGAELDVPLVGTVHYLTQPLESRWGETSNPSVAQAENRWLHTRRDLITISDSMRNLLRQHYPSCGEPVVIRNSINAATFMKTELSEEARARLRGSIAKPSERIVLFAGRINPMKGLSALIASAARVHAEHSNVRYLVAGAPDSREYMDQIRRQIEQHPGLSAVFTFLGRVPRDKLALLYQVADISVFPSIYEPLGMVAAEAMLCGVPPVVSRVGGLMEIVEHERTGLHVAVHADASGRHHVDVDELARAQLRLLRDEPLRRELGCAGRNYMRNQHSFEENMLAPTLDVYRRLVVRHRAREVSS